MFRAYLFLKFLKPCTNLYSHELTNFTKLDVENFIEPA